MVSSSKILTVSYGTFSCTAEGFDDPLAVVKEATQFFRGVVGEDRFFGAEPPQFDPELAGDIMRAQLGGRHGAGTVSLGRPGSGALAAGPARGAEIDRGLPDDDTIEATAVLTERPLRESAEAGPDDGLTAPVSAQGLAKTSQPPVGDADGIAASAAMEDTAATPVAAATETRATEAEALAGDAPAPRPSEPVGSSDPVGSADPAGSAGAMGTAAKLDRIRAVVAGHGAPVAAVAAAAGPLVADPAPQESPAPGRTAEAPEPAPSLLVDDGFIEPEHTLAAPQTREATEQDDEDQTLAALLGALQEDPQAQTDAPSGDAGLTALATPDLDAAALDADEDRAFADTIAGLMAGAEDTPPAPLADQTPDEVQAEAEDTPQAEAEPAETAPAAAEPVEAEAEAADHDSQPEAPTAETAAPEAEVPAVAPEAEAPLAETEEPAPMAEAEAPVAEAEREQDEAADLRAASDAPEQDEAAEARAAEGEEVDEVGAVFEPSAEEAEVPQPDAEPLAAEAEAPQPAAAEAAPQPRAEAGAAPVRARVVKVKRADFEKAVASGTLEEVQDEAEGSATSSLSAEEEEELARELAAVKAELSAGFDGWDDEEDDEDAAPQAARRQDHGSAEDDLDDEDEDEEAAFDARLAAAAPLRLDNPISRPDRNWSTDIDALDARASAALDRAGEDSDPAIDEAVRDSARKAVKMASPARALLTEGPVADQDTSRLIDQTNSEMDEPEGNRRRSAIAHLRAAVAATKADRLMGSRKPEVSDAAEAYREDLASVVRPRRPQAPTEAGARTERPAAPLKLVAEQRVTAPAGSDTPNTVPIRPRRVRRLSESRSPRDSAPAVESDGSGFAAYAESVGAADLPELLEAAAAYMSYVEGRDQFSRPQLMTTVRQAEATESSREDRLRSFGQLLREGKIRKTTGGRFTASERISFRPDRAVS